MQDHRYAKTDLPNDRTSFERPGVVLALDQPERNGVNFCQKPAMAPVVGVGR
jgi:hypothetical protein